jgi:hypothetical protein
MLNPDELAIVEEWRFEKRFPSRSEAVRALFLRGLHDGPTTPVPIGARSQDFGVVKAPEIE